MRAQARFPLAVLAGVYALAFLLPIPADDGRILGLPSICPFNNLTGLPCPGCGLTRGFVCLAHGRFVEALHWHPLSPFIFLLGLLALVENAARVFANRSILPPPTLSTRRATWAGAAVFLVFGIARAVYYATEHIRF